MSRANVPEQSFGGGLPPELTLGVRKRCGLTHSVPPWNGIAARPVVPLKSSPFLLLSTLVARMTKRELAAALDPPVKPIVGAQPREFTLAVQYVTGGVHVGSMRATLW